MAITLTGLASGLDTESVVAQLMALEQNKITAVQRRQTAVTQHKADLSNIKAKLDAVKSAAADLASSATWKASQTSSTSDATKVDATLIGGAGIGGHTLQVNKLASSAQHGYAFTPNAAAGKITLFYGTDPNAAGNSKLTIDVGANATATDIATAINANEGSPVYAAVVKDGADERLVFSARKTGASSDFTVDTSQLAGGQLTEVPTYARTGTALNAEYVLDGEVTPRTSETNIIENAVPGVRLTLKGITTSPVSVNTTQATIDSEAITKKITALVDAYNAVVTMTRSELAEKKVPTATTNSDLQKGQLFGDSGMSSMLSQLKRTMTSTLSGLGLTGLADIGITVPKATGAAATEDAKAGKLVVDSEKLKTTLAADYTKIRDLFAGKGTDKGLSAVISDYVGTQTGTNGMITSRVNTDDLKLKDFTKTIEKMNARMATEEKRLKAQFAAMETALNNSQAQQAWLTSQIATLPVL
jgi:flagellar hook-associated protein 2